MLIGIIRRKRIINSNFITPLAKDFFQSQGLSEAEEDRGDRSQKRKLQTDLLSCFQAPAVDTTDYACGVTFLSRFSTPAAKSIICSETISRQSFTKSLA